MEKEERGKEIQKIGADIAVLKQLVDSLDESEKKLEEFYKKNDPENLNKVKKFISMLVDKISESTK